MFNLIYKYVKLLFNKLFFIVVYMNGFIQSDNIFTRIISYFSNDVNLYVLENNTMISCKKLKYIEKYNASKYYITVDIDNNSQKYLVFNDKKVLTDCYHNIKDIVLEKVPKFSTYMEVINKTNNVTKYNIKSSDLYDFKNSCFVVNPNDTIEVTKMNLDVKIVESGQELINSLEQREL